MVNLSVGWIYDQSLNDMVEALVASGIPMFIAAGNDNVSTNPGHPKTQAGEGEQVANTRTQHTG